VAFNGTPLQPRWAVRMGEGDCGKPKSPQNDLLPCIYEAVIIYEAFPILL